MRRLNLNHSTYQHLFHIVWGTRYRRKFLKEYVKPEFKRVLETIEKKYPTIHIEAMNVDNDHVHLQMEIPPNLSVASVVKRIKWLTSLRFKKKFKFIREMYLDGNIWSVGYFSSTIGLNEKIVKDYIARQGQKDLPKQERLVFS
jgi:putative transposase